MNQQNEVQYRLYCKHPGQKTFSAVDWTTGLQVTRLIYASLFTKEEKVKVDKSLVLPKNKNIKFDWRKV